MPGHTVLTSCVTACSNPLYGMLLLNRSTASANVAARKKNISGEVFVNNEIAIFCSNMQPFYNQEVW